MTTTPPAASGPNLFSLNGHDVSVTITLGGIDGKPSVSYHDSAHVLQFTGDQVTVEETGLGRLVTVTTVRTVDVGSTTFTVVLPALDLAGGNDRVTTIGVTTRHRTTLGAIGHGQLTTYTVFQLEGTAAEAEF